MPAVSPNESILGQTNTRVALVAASASRIPGTNTLGMIEVNSEPGPRTTRSALRIASTASSFAAGHAGSRRTSDMVRRP